MPAHLWGFYGGRVGRPPLALGTAGAMRLYRSELGWRARCLYRDYDGRVRAIERSARTKTGAQGALKLAIRDRAHVDTAGDITPDMRVAVLAEMWFAGITDHSPTTTEKYRLRLDRNILPALGNLRVRELSIGTIDRHLRVIAAKNGPGTAKMTRSVLSGMCLLAARHDALDRNPVRDAGTVSSARKRAPRALTVDQVHELRAALSTDPKAVTHDLADFVAFMLATGMRVGEAAAVTWDAIDLDAGTVEVRGTVVRLKGRGLVVQKPKSDAGVRTLALPLWCVEMLRRRPASGTVFPAPLGGLRDPSNTQRSLRGAFRSTGFGWLTSHGLRKTTATLLDAAGLSGRAIADQLGHAKPSVTTDVYLGRKIASQEAADALGVIG